MVSDKGAAVNKSRIYVSNTYTEGLDMAGAKLGHQQAAQTLVGKAIMLKADCSTCHKISTKSIGPAFTQVSAKYQTKAKAADYITSKVINGSKGVWGEVPMPAHPTMKAADVKEIAEWIMTLSAKSTTGPSLPATGKIVPPAETNKDKSVLNIKATYSDLGAAGLKPLSNTKVLNLRSNVINAADIKDISDFGRKDADGVQSLILPQKAGWIKLKGIDLTNVAAFNLNLENANADYSAEIRLGGKDGQVIGKQGSIASGVAISPVTDGKFHDVYIVVKAAQEDVKDRPLLKAVTVKPI
ncbi:c-type cytochrome [Pedobacter steynii]